MTPSFTPGKHQVFVDVIKHDKVSSTAPSSVRQAAVHVLNT